MTQNRCCLIGGHDGILVSWLFEWMANCSLSSLLADSFVQYLLVQQFSRRTNSQMPVVVGVFLQVKSFVTFEILFQRFLPCPNYFCSSKSSMLMPFQSKLMLVMFFHVWLDGSQYASSSESTQGTNRTHFAEESCQIRLLGKLGYAQLC